MEQEPTIGILTTSDNPEGEMTARSERSGGMATAAGKALRQTVAGLKASIGGKDERGRTQRAALTAFGIRMMSAGIAYLSQVVLARWMGSFEYGVFVFVWVWVLVLGGLSSLGLGIASIRFVPEHRERGELALLRGLLLQSRLIALGVSSAVMLLGLLGVYLLGDWIDSHYVLPAYLALICLPLYSLTDVQDGIGRAHSWIPLALVPPYVLRPLLILVAMVVVHGYGLPMEATTATGCAILATWAAGVIQLAFLQRHLTETIEPGPRAYATRIWLMTALPIFLVSLFELVLQNADVLVLSHYVSPSEVGVYFAALKTISLIAFVHYAVGSAVAGQLSMLNARGDSDGLRAVIRDAARWTFWPSLAGALLLLATGRAFLSLFGPEFVAGYPAMFVLVVGLLIRASMGPAEYVLRMLGQQTGCAVVFGISAVFNIALNVLLIPAYGLLGAAAASSASLASASIAFYMLARRRLGVNISIWGRP